MQKNIMLSNRLLMTAQFVYGGSKLVDVGTDHAYLPVFLIQNGVIEKAIACDIHQKPLENARKTVESCGLSDKVFLCISDGLKNIKSEDADEIVIAGMGGTLISEIIEKAPWLKDKNKHLILQPQTKAEQLRAFLYDSGYEILEEKAVFEGKRLYIAMHAVFLGAKKSYTLSEAYIGGFCNKNDEAAREYLRRQAEHINLKIKGCKISGDEQGEKLLSLVLKDINEVINA